MKGNHTDKAIERASQSLQFVKEIEESFTKAVADEEQPFHKSKDHFKYASDFNQAIAIILKCQGTESDLLTKWGKRHHEGEHEKMFLKN